MVIKTAGFTYPYLHGIYVTTFYFSSLKYLQIISSKFCNNKIVVKWPRDTFLCWYIKTNWEKKFTCHIQVGIFKPFQTWKDFNEKTTDLTASYTFFFPLYTKKWPLIIVAPKSFEIVYLDVLITTDIYLIHFF